MPSAVLAATMTALPNSGSEAIARPVRRRRRLRDRASGIGGRAGTTTHDAQWPRSEASCVLWVLSRRSLASVRSFAGSQRDRPVSPIRGSPNLVNDSTAERGGPLTRHGVSVALRRATGLQIDCNVSSKKPLHDRRPPRLAPPPLPGRSRVGVIRRRRRGLRLRAVAGGAICAGRSRCGRPLPRPHGLAGLSADRR